MKYFALVATFSILLIIPQIDAEASSNPNLFVSAENSQFNNYFSGSMVIEVVVSDPNLHDTDEGKGEPDVTINGKSLRMVQATDGNWYAYFANVDKAKIADSTVGLSGEGLDFGVFCSRDTSSSVFGISLSDTDGFAVPPSAGLGGSTNGVSSFSSCTGPPTGPTSLINVVRNAKSINTNPNISTGQIGLDVNAWPLIQLYSFDDVTIQYSPGGSSQQVSLEYDEIQNISFSLDRDLYPENAEVFFTVNDFQLNQDPTDEDSWTFDVGTTPSTFYQAYDENGQSSANGGAGLVDLISNLSNIGFEDNGKLSVNLNSIIELQSNDEQPSTSVTDGTTTYSEIITLVEGGPNSGIFDTADYGNQSVIGILDDAPRGQTGSITYNKNSISILTGSSSATVSLENPTLTIGTGFQSLKPGTEFPVVLIDPDQNINSGSDDDLDVFRSTAIIPSLTIGNPITLENAQDVQFHSSSPVLVGGDDYPSSVPDSNSDRLIIDSSNVMNSSYEMISMNLGIPASALSSTLLDVSESNTDGTSWINYDLRSLENDYGVSDFGDTSFTLSFGILGSFPITIVDAGDISSSHGFIQIDDADIALISDQSGTMFLVIDFDSTATGDVLTISNEVNDQPIVFDFFSFGVENSNDANNAIYRFELEETSDNSSTFDGTMEYSVANQLNILDPEFIKTIQTIDDQIKFIVTDRLVDDEGISISYSDLDATGIFTTISSQSNINTSAGVISSDSKSYRFGQPVTLTLNDPDLNLKSNLVDIYFTINDPSSPNVDTVGKDGIALLEVLIKDIRFKRCTVDGVAYGGLSDTGFTLVETGPSTGIFEGVFKMPSKICNKSGTELISSAGGSLDAKYHDSRDDFGNANVFSLLRNEPTSFYTSTELSAYNVVKSLSGDAEEIILSGNVDNPRRGIPLDVVITTPDGQTQNFASILSSAGNFRSIITIDENTLSGVYKIDLFHNNSFVKTVSFVVSNPIIPDWIKNNAKWWSSDTVSDTEFIDGLEYLVEQGLITIPLGTSISISEQEIPNWIKNNAKWWSNDQISDEDFVKSIQYLVKKGIIRI